MRAHQYKPVRPHDSFILDFLDFLDGLDDLDGLEEVISCF